MYAIEEFYGYARARQAERDRERLARGPFTVEAVGGTFTAYKDAQDAAYAASQKTESPSHGVHFFCRRVAIFDRDGLYVGGADASSD